MLRSHLIAMLACSIASATAHGGIADEMPLVGKTVWKLADLKAGREAISRPDAFLAALSPFDRQARLKTDREVSEPEFLKFVAEQVLEWSAGDAKLLADVAASIRQKLAPFRLPLPDEVLLVKTTGREEGRAAYCRGAAVVLPEHLVTGQRERVERLLIHELFHVLSNQNPELRRQLYAVIGFRPCGEVPLPESLRPRRITNPDAPRLDYYIDAEVDDETVSLVPILYASQDRYDPQRGGEFFSYLTFKLLQVEHPGSAWRPKLVNGAPVLLNPADVPGYHDEIGRNTKYIIHPDEVLADNFVLLVGGEKNLPTPRVVAEMAKILTPSP